MHQTVKCICGVTIANCRCPGPKQIIIKKPCVHKPQKNTDGIGDIINNIADAVMDIFSND